ncbi:hypothetical protein VUR80DRAFT_7539 [Thermomyces stellatus]
MQLSYFVALFTATVAMAAPNPAPEEAPALKSRQDACLPASCASFGCCSGDCGYWCRACDISYTC